MDKFYIPIPEDTQFDLLVQRQYLTRSQLEKYQTARTRIEADAESASDRGIILPLLQQERLVTEPECAQIASFLDFLRELAAGICWGQMAMEAGIIIQSDFEAALIIQRAIYVLKSKLVPLAVILERKQKVLADQRQALSAAWLQLSVSEQVAKIQTTIATLLMEDRQDREWRDLCAQGILGIKYTDGTAVPPPSKLEDQQAVAALMPAATETSNPEPKVVMVSGFQNKGYTIHDLPAAESEIALEAPPSKLYDFEIDATEPFMKPQREPQKKMSPAVVSLILATLLVGIVLGFLVISAAKQETKLVNEIEYLMDTKEYAQAQVKCRQFRQEYPKSAALPQVLQHLQRVLYIQAEIAQRQEKWDEAGKTLQELSSLQPASELAEQAKKLEQEIVVARDLFQKKSQLQEEQRAITQFLQTGDIASAKASLSRLKRLAVSLHREEIAQTLSQAIVHQELQQARARYRYYPQEPGSQAPELSLTWQPTLPPHMTLKRLLLTGKQYGGSLSDSTGHFFTVAAGYLYALSAADGKVLWIEYLGSGTPFYPLFIAGTQEYFNMALVDKVLAVAPATNSLRLLNAETGDRVWETVVPGVISAQPVVHKGKIYVGALDHACYQLDILSGLIEGKYLAGGPIEKIPVVDKRSGMIYLCTMDAVYGYHLASGKLSGVIGLAVPLAASPVAIAPYLGLCISQENKTSLSLYSLAKPGHPEIVQTVTIPGTMSTPAALAGGMLAIATDSHLALFGINPANRQEALFSLRKPIALAEKGAGLLRFGNLLRHLLLVQKEMTLYKLSGFEEAGNNIAKTAVSQMSEASAIDCGVLPIQQCGPLFLWTQSLPDDTFQRVVCVEIYKDQIRPAWSKQLATALRLPFLMTPDDRVLALTSQGTLHELYLNSRQEPCYRVLTHQSDQPNLPMVWTALNSSEGGIFLMGKEIKLVDGLTGWEKNWKPQLAALKQVAGAVAAEQTLFLGTADGVFSLSVTSGQKKCMEYSEFQGKPFFGKPVYSDRSLWIGCDNGQLYQFQVTSSNPLPYLQKIWTFQAQGPIRSRPLVAANMVYFGAQDNYLYAVDVKKRQLLWKFAAAGPIQTTPAVDGNVIYFGADDRHLYALDAKAGTLLWQRRLAGKIRATPLVSNNRIYLGSLAGDFHIYDPTGNLLGQIQVGGTIENEAVTLANMVLVGSSDGIVYVLEEK